MSEPLPFHVSPEVAEYIRRVAVIPEMEAGISLCLKITAQNDAGEITDCYDAPNFTIGWHAPGIWDCPSYQIAGREFFITPQTLEALAGKTLRVLRRYEG